MDRQAASPAEGPGPLRRGQMPRMLAGPLFGVLVVGLMGCQSGRKLSNGGPIDTLMHDVLGQERSTEYYYGVVRGSHDPEDFQYHVTEDPYLVDKNVHAVTKLGGANYPRLEGKAQVTGTLVDVILEDPSALARANAAGSLARFGTGLPAYPQRGPEDRGGLLVSTLQSMDALVTRNGVRRPGTEGQMAALVTRLGDLKTRDASFAQQALRPFHNRRYLVDETNVALRQAIDTALVKRLRSAVVLALETAVLDESVWVRADALRGLKTVAAPEAMETVLGQMDLEDHWRVRSEGVEYLARIGSAAAVAALIPLLDDSDAGIRLKAHAGLVRIAGRDLGTRRGPWTRWARARWPGEEIGEADDADPMPSGGRAPPVPPAGTPPGPLPVGPGAGPSGPPPVPPTQPPPTWQDPPMPRGPPAGWGTVTADGRRPVVPGPVTPAPRPPRSPAPTGAAPLWQEPPVPSGPPSWASPGGAPTTGVPVRGSVTSPAPPPPPGWSGPAPRFPVGPGVGGTPPPPAPPTWVPQAPPGPGTPPGSTPAPGRNRPTGPAPAPLGALPR